MCLACELDALWYAEWDRLAAEGANAARTAGAPSALADDAERRALAEGEETAATAPSPPSSLKDDAGPAAPGSGFRCEETE
jgi:hypothetical protein